MTRVDHAISAHAEALGVGSQATERAGLLRDLVELAKPGIVKMVAVTSVLGFALSALWRGGVGWGLAPAFVWMVVGVVFSAAGANALNQVIEAHRDARMDRTRRRPVASGRMGVGTATAAGVVYSLIGVAVLTMGAGPVPAAVSLVTIVTYLFWYTALKPVTEWSTVVGAFPGALPPLIGWTAAAGVAASGGVSVSGGASGGAAWSGLWEPGGWTLVAIMFVWQIPHFLAIGWKYRADYARGGYRILALEDAGGERTARSMLVWCGALFPVSLLPVMWAGPGVGYAVAATVLSIVFIRCALRFSTERSEEAAKGVFLASIAYLPLILLVMVADAAIASV